jgi:hypothetical protein
MRTAVAILCAAIFAAGCGDDDDTTVVETTTVTETETVTTPAEPDATTPAEPGGDEPGEDGGDGSAEAPRDCGRIVFEPNTDSGAFEIEAAGTDCATARAVVRAARDRPDDLSYVANSFRCTGERRDGAGLSSVGWVCIGADRSVVTFTTT